MIDNVKTDIQTMRSLSIVRPQAMSFYNLLDKPIGCRLVVKPNPNKNVYDQLRKAMYGVDCTRSGLLCKDVSLLLTVMLSSLLCQMITSRE